MSFGSGLDSILKGFSSGLYQGLFGSEYVKDYKHASKTFLSDGYALAPQTKFLFHVFFTLNTAAIPGLARAMGSARDVGDIGMMVKTAELPRYSVDVDELNQYNRKRHVQTKLNYQPVQISFHDDGSDLIRSMWYNYYSYYFSDAKHSYDGIGTDSSTGLSNGPFDYNRRDIYDNLRSVNEWGYDGSGPSGAYKPNFFKDIKIYGLNRGNFVEYTLINPTIIDWSHDRFDYSQGNDTMTNTMTVRYETVKYHRGKIGEPGNSEVRGWGDSAGYDTSGSKLSKPGSTQSIFGQAGLLDAGTSFVSDLQNGNLIGAALTAGRARETFKNSDLSTMIAQEGLQQVMTQGIALAQNRTVTNSVENFLFPKQDKASATNVPLNSLNVSSNNGRSNATNWKNPNVTAPDVPIIDESIRRSVNSNDVLSNGSVLWTVPPRTAEEIAYEQERGLPEITSPRSSWW